MPSTPMGLNPVSRQRNCAVYLNTRVQIWIIRKRVVRDAVFEPIRLPAYGTACALAKQLGPDQAARIHETLEEETLPMRN